VKLYYCRFSQAVLKQVKMELQDLRKMIFLLSNEQCISQVLFHQRLSIYHCRLWLYECIPGNPLEYVWNFSFANK
jgi:hypothetical protein